MRTWLRLTLTTLLVGGGFTGLVLTSQAIGSPAASGPATLSICVGFIALYTPTLAIGLLISHNPLWWKLVLTVLALQVPVVSFPHPRLPLDVRLIFSYHFGSF